MNKIISSLSSILILFFAGQLHSEEKVIYGFAKVIDGDSIKIGKESIRLQGIDAPEVKQVCKKKNDKPYMCGLIAKDALKNYIEFAKVKSRENLVYCYYSERDRYKRIIGKCFLGKESFFYLNEAMVLKGYAVAYTRYSKDYIEAENKAKAEGRGIWQGKFELPEDWRRKNK